MYKRRKHNRQTKSFDWYGAKQRFSIRKYHFGAASVLLGTLLPLVPNSVHAQDTEHVRHVDAETNGIVYSIRKSVPLAQGQEHVDIVETASEMDSADELKQYTLAQDKEQRVSLSKSESRIVTYRLKAKSDVEKAAATLEKSSTSVEPVRDEKGVESTTVAPEKVGESRSAFRSVPESTQMKINFYDAAGNKLDENSIYRSSTGQNMNITMEVVFPEGMTNKQIELTLGRFLTFADDTKTTGVEGTGETNETIKTLASVSAPQATETLTSLDGSAYKFSEKVKTKQKVVYRVNDSAVSLRVPLIVNSDINALLKGMSADGAINGSREGIEADTPISVLSSGEFNGQNVRESNSLNYMSIEANYELALPVLHRTNYSVPVENANANNRNGYLVGHTIGLAGRIVDGTTRSSLMYEAGTTFEIVTPAGVTVHSFSGNAAEVYEIAGSTTDNQGNIITTLRLTKPTKATYAAPVVFFSVDRAVFKGEEFTARVRNTQVKLRNYDTPFQTRAYTSNTIENNIPVKMQVFEYNEHENIGLSRTDIPAVTKTVTIPILTNSSTRDGLYAGLGSFGYRFIQNFDKTPTRAKELHYAFPSDPSFEVKGIKLTTINNGDTLTSVKVKSKQHPEWKTVTLPKPYTYKQGNVFIDLATLGLNPDDVLTEAIVPIGVIPAEYPGSTAHFIERASNVFGTLKEDFTGLKTSAIVTLRDMDYDANDPEHNYTLEPQNLQIGMRTPTTNLRVLVDSTKEVRFTERGSIRYTIDSFNEKSDYTQDQSLAKVDKAFLVLPSEVDVNRFVIKMNNTDITKQLVQTQETRDGKTIYTLDFSNVQGLNRYVGWLGEYGSGVKENKLTVEAYINNQVDDAIDVPYHQTLFIQTAHQTSTIGFSSVNNVDPYQLTDNDALLFTNKPTTNYLRLSKQDRLDVSSSAKLDTNLEYNDTSELFVIKDKTTSLDIKYAIKNPTTNDVNGIDMFIPIPKKGQNWGSNFQDGTKPFDYTLELLNLADSSETLRDILEISYATVDASKLTGAITHNTQELANETFTTNPSDLSQVNLVRLRVKDGKVLPAKFAEDVHLRFALRDVTEKEDGKSIAWNPYYAAAFLNHSVVEKAKTTTIELALGKLKVQVFKDEDRNATQEANEENWADVTVTLLDSDNNVIATKQTNGTNAVEFEELVSGKVYKVNVTNPNTAEYNFTTAGENTLLNSVVSVEATKTPLADTPITKIGLGRKQNLVNEPILKKDAEDTPAISAGKALIDGSDKPESPLSDADKAIVKDKVDTSNLPDGTTLTPADKVSADKDGNPVVEVIVTYPDGTTDTINVPVKQKDKATNEPQLKPDAENTPEISAGKALIDGSDKPESPLSDADKAIVKDKVDTSNLPDGTTLTPADKVSADKDGNPVVEVIVTYPDGTTDTINVPVKQKDKATNEPQLKQDAENTPAISAGKALIDGSDKPESPLSDADKAIVKDKVDTSNLPDGTTLTPADQVSADKDGNPVVQVTVTYPDGTTDTINVPVKQKDNMANTPTIKEGTVLIEGSDKPGSQLSPEDKEAIKNMVDTSKLPEGTNVSVSDKVSADKDGNPVVEVTITYPDGTSVTVNIPVKQVDNAIYRPEFKPAVIEGSVSPNAPLSKEDQELIASQVTVPNAPEGTIIVVDDKVSVDEHGNPVVVVAIVYPDGSVQFVYVPVSQKVSEQSSDDDSKQDNNTKKQGQLPYTGSEKGNNLLSLAGVMSMFGGLFIAKKRKNKKDEN
ncbi:MULTISPECIES: Rib/alpha-like domain-containing protein [unclassified Granulicatella]|uniref:Rib/alpha-like domain-containing protein n=1 Tax=unclassified Granulicatella TaxID=2630493 RepID=UPI0014303E28|nr:MULTISPECIES: Rib/alpha-like domain-containing protein [unclassified Granulicatella]MBF0780295.1 YSIRK-type signal peptide-containing protein [Granulicatella sp. 19428wC4_WM01]